MRKRSMDKEKLIPEQYAWTCFANIFIGLWLIFAVFTFGYSQQIFVINNLVCGSLAIVLSIIAMSHSLNWSANLVGLIGIWLQFSAIFFWAKDPAVFLNESLSGIMLIMFSNLVPKTHQELKRVKVEIPPGWTYNPSAWIQRVPTVFLGTIAWFLARYMAAYQLGYIDTLWDPVFGDGTLKVIDSPISHSFPVSDAGLGAAAYTLDVVMGCQGGTNRWYTMPWCVVFFGILVIPLGAISILLIIIQPILVGAWCFWCLITALIMLLMIAFTVNEVIVVLQYLHQVKKNKLPFWEIFWKGGEPFGGKKDQRSPHFSGSLSKIFPAMFWGMTFPWNLLVSIVIGIYVMFSPPLMHSQLQFANSSYIVGALSVVVSVIALGEGARITRFFNVVLGGWMIVSVFALNGSTGLGKLNMIVCGIALILLSIRRGPIKEKYGDWQRCIR